MNSRIVFLLTACAAAAGVLASALSGCDDGDVPLTSDYDLSEITVQIEAMSNGETVIVSASLTVPVPQENGISDVFAELAPGDTLTLRAGTETRELVPSGDARLLSHVAMLRSNAADVEITLERGTDRVAKGVVLPASFVLQAPAQPVAVDASIEIAWAPVDSALMVVRAFGPCLLEPFSRQLEQDTGGYAIQPGELAFDQSSGPCELSVSVERLHSGSNPYGMGPGTVGIAQVRTVAVEVTR